MITYILNLLQGYLLLELQGDSPERFFNMCMHHNIKIWNMNTDSNFYRLCMTVKDYKRTKPLIKKSNIQLQIVEKIGVPFIVYRYRKRKVFLAGFLFGILSLYLLSFRIWGIDIQGNLKYTDETFIELLNTQGTEIAMKSSYIDCDELESLIRKEFYDIIWVSVHIDGSMLIINVKENETTTSNEFTSEISNESINQNQTITTTNLDINELYTGYDIVAETSGTIDSIITRKGIPMVHAGDTVEAGDILVSGCIEIMNDYDEIVACQYVTAEADILIQTTQFYSDEIMLTYRKKFYLDTIRHYIYIKKDNYIIYPIKKEILLDENIYQEISTKEFQLSPDQQTLLTLFFGIETVKYYQFVETTYTENEAQEILTLQYQTYYNDLKEKKVEIIENNVKIHIDENKAIASGNIEVIYDNTLLQLTEIQTPLASEAKEG
ncbi:MAG: sporulation protein YqfD [Eubacteriales bacterium]